MWMLLTWHHSRAHKHFGNIPSAGNHRLAIFLKTDETLEVVYSTTKMNSTRSP
jgi:hypothetical protein